MTSPVALRAIFQSVIRAVYDERPGVRTATHALGLALTSAIFLTSALYHPADTPGFTVCIFKNLTGIDCPGCGLTRAFCALAKGGLTRAVHFNASSPLIFTLCGLWWIRSLLRLMRRDRLAARIETPFRFFWTWAAIFFVMLAAWTFKIFFHAP
jgi:hypothetical protein